MNPLARVVLAVIETVIGLASLMLLAGCIRLWLTHRTGASAHRWPTSPELGQRISRGAGGGMMIGSISSGASVSLAPPEIAAERAMS
jgi:hypothetical protein